MRYLVAKVVGEDFYDHPDWVIAPLDERRLHKILEVQQLCVEHELSGADVLETSLEWGYNFTPEAPTGSIVETTSISKFDVQYSALPKASGPQFTTSPIPIAQIKDLAKQPDGAVLFIEGHGADPEDLPTHIAAAYRAQALEKRVGKVGPRRAPTGRGL